MENTEAEEVQEWGRAFLRDNGSEVADDEHVSFEEGFQGEGCCDWCYYEAPIVAVMTASAWRDYRGHISDMFFSVSEGVFY